MTTASRRLVRPSWRVAAAVAVVALATASCAFPDVAFDSSDGSIGAGDATTDAPGNESSASGSHDANTGDASGRGDAADASAGDGSTDAAGADESTDVARGDGSSDATVFDASDGGVDAHVDAMLDAGTPASDGGADVYAADATADDGAADDAADAGGVRCDCDAAHMFPTNVSCSLLGTGLLCTGTSGFTGAGPPCGEAGSDFVTCQSQTLACASVASPTPVVQQCVP